MLGFYVDKKTKPGWHALSVKLDQKAELRHRKGFEFGTAGKAQPSDFQLAISSPLPYTDVQINGRFTNMEGNSGKRHVQFELNLPPEAIGFGEQDNALKLEIMALARGIDGKEVAKVSQRIDRRWKPSKWLQFGAKGFTTPTALRCRRGPMGCGLRCATPTRVIRAAW
jgi:hypothetical protein